MIQVVYTNSNCSDVLKPFAAKNKKYSGLPLYVISDYTPDISMNGLYNYDNADPYYEVWVRALELFGSEYFIYLQVPCGACYRLRISFWRQEYITPFWDTKHLLASLPTWVQTLQTGSFRTYQITLLRMNTFIGNDQMFTA